MTFDLVAHTKAAARDALNGLENPEDDIIPVVLTYGPRGLSILGGRMSGDEQEKDRFADVITARIAIHQAEEATMVCAAYVSLLNPASGEVTPKQETVVLIYSTKDRQRAWTAKVTRHDHRPPDMSVWEELGDGMVAGRFAQALELGLALASTSTDPEMQEILDAGHREGRVDELVDIFLAAKSAVEGNP